MSAGRRHCQARSAAGPRIVATSSSGAHSRSIRRHWASKPTGAMTRAADRAPASLRRSRATTVCTVLPRPMSSASRRAGEVASARTPSSWNGRSRLVRWTVPSTDGNATSTRLRSPGCSAGTRWATVRADPGSGIAFEIGILPVVHGNLHRLGLRNEVRVEPDEIPLVDPGTHVLAHPGGSEAFQTGDVGRVPAEGIAVDLLEAPIGAIELGVVRRLDRHELAIDDPHPNLRLAGQEVVLGALARA